MRIAHVVPRGEQPSSGVLTVIVHLCAALSRQGHDVEIWQLHHWGPDYEEQRKTLFEAGVDQVRTARRDAPWWSVASAVARLPEERHIEIVHLHGAFNVWNTLISRRLRRPYVFSPHSGYDPVSLRRSRSRKILYGLLFERSMLRRAALIVALTDVELVQLRGYGVRTPAVVIPNGVNRPRGDHDGARFRSALRIGPQARLAIFVGRLDLHRKGLDLLVRGVAGAPEWHLALLGPRFRDVPRVERLIEELGVAERVHVVGERHGDRLHEAVAAAGVFTLLSRWEGLPMALPEALSLGKPAVVSPGVDRLVPVRATGAGWVAEADRLPAVLHEVAGTRPQGFRRRQEAARLLAERYNWDSVGRHTGWPTSERTGFPGA
jgi:glycosyltransferase involved in cell wall biosynthesis